MKKGQIITLLTLAFLVTLLYILFDGNKTNWLLSLIVIELGALLCKGKIDVNVTNTFKNKTGSPLILEKEEEQQ